MNRMDMTKKEYLESLQKKADETLDIRSVKGITRKFLHASVLFIVVVIVVAAGRFGTNMEREKAYASFLEGGTVSYEHLNYKDTFVRWNQNATGNDVNVLLSGGKILMKDGLIISGVSIGGINDGFLFLGNISYINKVQDEIVYRDNKDRYIYGYNVKTKIKRVSSFAVCANNIIYLNTKQELYRKIIGQSDDRKLVSHIERFFINGNIIAESKNIIIEFTPTGDNSHVIYQSDVSNMRLVGSNGKDTYIQEDSNLICLSESDKITLVGDAYSLFGSIIANPNGVVYGAGYMEKDGKVSPQLFKAMKKVD